MNVYVWDTLVTPMPAHIMPESISGRGGFRIVIALAAAVEAIFRMIYTKNFNPA